VGARVAVRAARGSNDFPRRTGVGTLLPLHLASEQIQKIVHFCIGLSGNVIAPRFCRRRELKRNPGPCVGAAVRPQPGHLFGPG
jgi:hypothetical protein